MAIERPKFLVQGLRSFSEKTMPAGILGIGVGFLFPPVLGWALGLTFADLAINNFTADSRIAPAAS